MAHLFKCPNASCVVGGSVTSNSSDKETPIKRQKPNLEESTKHEKLSIDSHLDTQKHCAAAQSDAAVAEVGIAASLVASSVCDVPPIYHPDTLLPCSTLHPALWARWDPTTSDFCYVWIETKLSRAVGEFRQWNFEKLSQTRKASKYMRMQDWFDLFLEILQDPIVHELLEFFAAGYVPATMAAELGEKERAAAFAEPHPLAWIDLDAPVIVASNRRENVFGYSCITERSYMLRVVGRGFMNKESTWYSGYADFIQHGQLALIKQAYPVFFQRLPVGLHLNRRLNPTAHRTITELLVPHPAHAGDIWNFVKKTKFEKRHIICYVILTALTCEDAMFAHPMTNPDGPDDSANDVPFCVGGSGTSHRPFSIVSYNKKYVHYRILVTTKVNIQILQWNRQGAIIFFHEAVLQEHQRLRVVQQIEAVAQAGRSLGKEEEQARLLFRKSACSVGSEAQTGKTKCGCGRTFDGTGGFKAHEKSKHHNTFYATRNWELEFTNAQAAQQAPRAAAGGGP